MNTYLISSFIDDELDLDEKVQLVQWIHRDVGFKDEALNLISQEKMLRSDAVATVPPVVVNYRQPRMRLLALASGFLSLVLLLGGLWLYSYSNRDVVVVPYRFVIYQPQVTSAQIAGSFTQWQPLELTPAGRSGYWEIVLDLPAGEHRYSYILDGRQRVADPTVVSREADDFGGENSILEVRA